jgi:hypothetical protein
MKTKRTLSFWTLIAMVSGFACPSGFAQLPPDFPGIVVSNYNPAAVSPGCVFLAVASDLRPAVGVYLMIVTNDGSVVWHAKLDVPGIHDFKVAPNGRLVCAPFVEKHSWTGGGDAIHQVRDASYNLIETITGGNGYVADSHDVQLLPNGNVLQLGYYLSEVDMSQVVPGGHPAAHVSGGLIQELDAQRNVVFQWRSWDHYGFQTNVTSTNAVIDAYHLNTIDQDTDGHLLVATPDWVKKVNRQTGAVMWTLGGPDNQFSFAGGGAPSDLGGHNLNRLPNGNVLIYDNGGAGTNGAPSKVHEYQLNEINKVATRVWTYTSSPAIQGWHAGNAQRLANGNTFIGWGGASGAAIPTCTEVTSAGQKVFEIYFTNSLVESYSAFRFTWPPTDRLEQMRHELADGNTYPFPIPGVTLDIISGGAGYNSLTVIREPYAPLDPVFMSAAARLLPLRVNMREFNIPATEVNISFDAISFGFSQPDNLTVYYRSQAGQGVFLPQLTGYNPGTHQLLTTLTMNSTDSDLGEFAFGYSELPDVPFAPLLAEVENDRGLQTHEVVAPKLAATGTVYTVNQQLPVLLSWSPKGLARWYELQIATNLSFTSLEVEQPYTPTAYYVWSNAAPDTTYHYRVKTWNDGGESDWSTGSFQTAAPLVRVTVPNGGEVWQRGLQYYIQWRDNLAEPVIIDLYKGGAFLQSLNTNASAGACQWEIPLDLALGSDYSIKIRSATNAGMSDLSDLPFSIVGSVPVTIATAPAGLALAVDGTNYLAPANFNWLSGSAHTLTALSPQTAPDGHSRSVFGSWSDGGTQTNLITVPAWATNFTASFSTQYLLETAVNPTAAGTISNYPAGPWYAVGQLVSLTARTNTGYRINFWQGADSATGNTAQVTMNDYRLVQANFLPFTFPYLLVTNSGGAAPGQLIGNIGGRNAEGTRTTYVILDNTGTNAIYSSTTNTLHRFVTPQGFDAVGSSGTFQLKDETLNVVGTVSTLGPTLDTHDIELWPNGHALLFAQEFRTVDMSQIVPGGKPNANVTGNVIQEIDANKRVVFEWHTFDHIAITNTFADMTQANFDYAHINCVTLDPTDNNLLASLRTTSEVVKINRRTGQVIWRLGGKMNQFTFIGEHPENAPYYTVGQHDVHRLANGNLLYFDNGNISGGGVTPNDRTYSRAVEYALDEVSMTATMVWEYRHSPDISAGCTGSLKRMANGNTFIDWGCAVPTSGFIVTEINPAGQVVFEMKHRQTGGIGSVTLGGGLLKQLWNSPDLIRSATYQGVLASQTYALPEAGVSVTISNLTGPAENTLVVQRHLDAVRFPQLPGKAPQVVMEHVVLAGSNITTLEAELNLSLPDTSYVFDTPTIHDPAQLVVYHRPTPGQGQFSVLPTSYDTGTQKLRVTTTQLGEFIFGYPDVDEMMPPVPVIASPADGSEVNQAAPVSMSWKPQGLFASCDLQVATDAGFTNLVLDTNNLGSTSFTLQNPLPNTQHFWRVRVVNQGGASNWASASFTTVPPVLQLTYPAGGEAWQRFQVVTIRWIDNIADNVALDIYKGGVSNRNFVSSTASSGSYTWTVGQFQAFPAGSDYTIKIRSTTNPSFYDFSEPFSIIAPPVLDSQSVTILPDGLVQFPVTVTGALQATVLGSTNLVVWESLQTVPLTNGAAVFTDGTATNFPARFYRLRVP